jgi:hypothetical protein
MAALLGLTGLAHLLLIFMPAPAAGHAPVNAAPGEAT